MPGHIVIDRFTYFIQMTTHAPDALHLIARCYARQKKRKAKQKIRMQMQHSYKNTEFPNSFNSFFFSVLQSNCHCPTEASHFTDLINYSVYHDGSRETTGLTVNCAASQACKRCSPQHLIGPWHLKRHCPISGLVFCAWLLRLPAQEPRGWSQGPAHHLLLSLGVALSRLQCHANQDQDLTLSVSLQLPWDLLSLLTGVFTAAWRTLVADPEVWARPSWGTKCFLFKIFFFLFLICLSAVFTVGAVTVNLTFEDVIFHCDATPKLILPPMQPFLTLQRSRYQIPVINLPLGCTLSGMENQTSILKARWRDKAAWYAAAHHSQMLIGCLDYF